jgi:hypothetical protein
VFVEKHAMSDRKNSSQLEIIFHAACNFNQIEIVMEFIKKECEVE